MAGEAAAKQAQRGGGSGVTVCGVMTAWRQLVRRGNDDDVTCGWCGMVVEQRPSDKRRRDRPFIYCLRKAYYNYVFYLTYLRAFLPCICPYSPFYLFFPLPTYLPSPPSFYILPPFPCYYSMDVSTTLPPYYPILPPQSLMSLYPAYSYDDVTCVTNNDNDVLKMKIRK